VFGTLIYEAVRRIFFSFFLSLFELNDGLEIFYLPRFKSAAKKKTILWQKIYWGSNPQVKPRAVRCFTTNVTSKHRSWFTQFLTPNT
jgi:glucan biosynthesis protein